MTIERNPLDVWLRFAECDEEHTDDACDCDEAEYEANTFEDPERGFYVKWYHNAVGLVTTESYFATWEEAARWLTNEGYQDFSS